MRASHPPGVELTMSPVEGLVDFPAAGPPDPGRGQQREAACLPLTAGDGEVGGAWPFVCDGERGSVLTQSQTEDLHVDFSSFMMPFVPSQFIARETHFGQKPRQEVMGVVRQRGRCRLEAPSPAPVPGSQCGSRWTSGAQEPGVCRRRQGPLGRPGSCMASGRCLETVSPTGL